MVSFRSSVARLVVLACACAAASCATIRADSDYYSAMDFSKYHRFAWVSDSPLIRAESARVEISPLTVRRVRETIEKVLQSKGFELAPNREGAEFALAFTVGARDMITMDDYPPYYHGVWDWGPAYYGPNVDANMYTEGMLAVDVFDTASREPVWHGWARKIIVGADVDDPEKTITAAVNAIFVDFPPKPK